MRLHKVYMHVRSRLSCPPSMYTAAELGVGICLTLLGACLLALSMVVQRYGAWSHIHHARGLNHLRATRDIHTPHAAYTKEYIA